MAAGEGPVDGLPSAEAVVRGWEAHGRTGLRIEVPDPVLQRSFDASRRRLLLVDLDEPGPAEVGAVVSCALGRLGRHTEADDLVRALWSRQRTDGSFDEPSSGGSPGGAHLWALGEHLRVRPDGELAIALDRGMVAAEGWLRELEAADRLSASGRRWATAGRRAAGIAADEAGLERSASALLAGFAGEPDGSHPPGPTAVSVLRLATDARPGPRSPAVTSPAGMDVVATLAQAAAEVVMGDMTALERLTWILRIGDPTWSWPDHVNPVTGGGSDGDGASSLASAAFVLLVRDLLVTEPAVGHAVLVPVVPEEWRGRPIEVHDAVLSGGVRLSFAIRWHGRAAALLWEASQPLHLSAPALDPSFASLEARGEVLLAAAASQEEAGMVELS